VNRLMSLQYDGFPPNHYNKYLDNIRSVTLDDIMTVAEKYLNPDSMTVMILADTSAAVEDFSDFGHVTHIALEEPKIE
jgi:predicted Zn-dependent peptidase